MKSAQSHLQHQADLALDRFARLRERSSTATGVDQDLIDEALEELAAALHELHASTEELREQNEQLLIAETRVAARVQRVGSMLTVFFRAEPVRAWTDAVASDTKAFAVWHAGLLARGVYWPPSQFEAAFVSAAHSPDDIAKTVEAASQSFGLIK